MPMVKRADIRNFCADQDGGITVLSLMLMLPILMLAGYAIDTGNVMAARTQLQIAADAAAHAALLERELHSEDDARALALDVAELNMPAERYGYVIAPENIEFGVFDHDAMQFTPDEDLNSAVRVIARRNAENGNGVRTFLLKLVGLEEWTLNVQSVFVTYTPTCLREGFVAQQKVDLQSNNVYTAGFCIHSNSYVSLNSNNYFEPGTVVSMSNLDDLDLPNSGYKTNAGLSEALREGSWNIRIIERIEDIIGGLKTLDDNYRPDYITSTAPIALKDRNIYQDDLTPGRLHTYSCNGGAALTIKNGTVVTDVVLISDCKTKFESGVVLQNSVIATTNTSAQSMTASSGLVIGKDDNCAPGGGVQLVTMGSISFPSGIQVYGSQLLSMEDIDFSANADGIQGAAFVAGGEISGTSNMSMGFCSTGMEDNFQADYFTLAL